MARKQQQKVPALNRNRRQQVQAENDPRFRQDEPRPIHPKRNTAPLIAQTAKQKQYIAAIQNFDVTFGLGPAGTGKSYVATMIAADMLDRGEVDRIIITRPAVESQEEFGFLPGELADKYEPYLAPIKEILYERLGKGATDYFVKSGRIEAIPLAFMRGRTFRDAFVIFDEAQNATPGQMKLFLTRIGDNCKVVIDGDAAQSDIPNSGLVDAANRVSHIPCVRVITFDRSDVVRSGFVSEVLAAYASD
ncbi:PhoH family protein [Castellaniella sp.]|uniref:PhoH family protein n=1 Tax=Castellaniella sp. TaxID=1955812 RepID=UPI002AFF484B|nr:PhoH family protein [Castellaniella sp.]